MRGGKRYDDRRGRDYDRYERDYGRDDREDYQRDDREDYRDDRDYIRREGRPSDRDYGRDDYRDDREGVRDSGGRDYGGRDSGGRDSGGRDSGGSRDSGGRDSGGRDWGRRDSGGRRDYGRRDYKKFENRKFDGGKRFELGKKEELSESEKLSELIAKIGDKPGPKLDKNLSGLAQVLLNPSTMEKHKTHILDMIFKCVLVLPTKTPIYAGLVGLINASSPDIGAEVLDRLLDELKVALRRNETYNMKYLIRFLIELSNSRTVETSNVFDVLELLLTVLDDSSNPQGRRDYFSFLVLTMLPFVGHKLVESNPERLSNMMDKLGTRIKDRDLDTQRAVSVFSDETPVAYVQWAYDVLDKYSKDKWPLSPVILRPYNSLAEQLEKSTVHTFDTETLEIPPPPEPSAPLSSSNLSNQDQSFYYPPPRNIFRLGLDTLPLFSNRTITDLERLMIEDYIRDLLFFFHADYKECISYITNLPLPCNFESVLDIVVETLFSELFCLPAPPFKHTYYGLIIAELCKTSKEFAPGVVAKAISNIYDKIPSLDVECYFILTEWFAHHLSNFDYKWLWTLWSNPPTEQHSDFVKEVLYRCMRLSYYERIEKAIPQELHNLLPEKPRPHFKYLDGPDVEGYKEAQQLYKKMLNKEEAESILKWLETEESLMGKSTPKLKADVLMCCILQVGAKSFSHFLTTIEKYMPLLNNYISNTETILQAIDSVVTFWKFNPQRAIICMSKLIMHRIITPASVVEWLLSDEMFHIHTKQWVWELLYIAIEVTLMSVVPLQKKLQTLEATTSDDQEVSAFKKTEEKLSAALQEQKEFFLILMQRFEMLLRTLIDKNRALENNKEEIKEDEENQNKTVSYPYVYKIDLGVFKSVGRRYYRQVRVLQETLDIIIQNTEEPISTVFDQIKSIILHY